MLAAGWLGDVFGWASQQNGALVHDICPQPGREYDQIGAGSEAELEWHTEESFHPYKCDYLGLLTLRNPGQAATTIGHVPPDTLPDWVRRELARPVFCFLPDDAHVAEAAASESVAGMISDPVPVPVLYGGPDGPYLQVDPAYMYVLADDEPARRALAHLTDRIDASLVDLPAGPGSIVFLDNYRVVHGRRPFVPRYDGTDRWLKRVNVTRNLRASRSMRTSAVSRIIT
ncbi:TauD/TfdA family dioxygenase [Catellatospora bangladeshensis]